MKFTVNFAKLNIEINCAYDYTYKFCRDYLSEGIADFSVSPTKEEIDEEIEVSEFNPSRGYAESICVYRKIADNLPLFDRMVFHGAVISYDNNGYIFTAPSGTGKTTHISLWKKFVEGVEIVNGDKPILWVDGKKVTAFATPYAGKEGFQNHSSIEIKGICIIHRGKENKIRRVQTSEFLTEMLTQMYIPPEAETTEKTLDMLDTIVRTIPVYILECDISEEAVKTSFETLTNTRYPVGADTIRPQNNNE